MWGNPTSWNKLKTKQLIWGIVRPSKITSSKTIKLIKKKLVDHFVVRVRLCYARLG